MHASYKHLNKILHGFDLLQKANIYRASFSGVKWGVTQNSQIHKTKNSPWSLWKKMGNIRTVNKIWKS